MIAAVVCYPLKLSFSSSLSYLCSSSPSFPSPYFLSLYLFFLVLAPFLPHFTHPVPHFSSQSSSQLLFPLIFSSVLSLFPTLLLSLTSSLHSPLHHILTPSSFDSPFTPPLTHHYYLTRLITLLSNTFLAR